MKTIYFFLIVFICSCQKGQVTESKNKTEKSSKESGSLRTELKFRKAKQNEIIRNDTLKSHYNFKNLKELKCETKFLANDYENEKYFIREYEIKISDTLLINVLQKQSKGEVVDYVYLYKEKNFNITNYYGRMFSRKADFFFDFETKKAHLISKDKLLLQDQPSTWCGLANQMDFFQIVDLKNMEIAQFVDYDTIVK
ncbi:MAG TPA: hypothetical protein VK623_05620 [Flavobacterium sp.]|nr:hypothetical protein [Flavobacterium sp.]